MEISETEAIDIHMEGSTMITTQDAVKKATVTEEYAHFC